MNILEAVHTCLTQAESERAAATVRTYRNGLNYFLRFIEEEKNINLNGDIAQVTADHFVEFPAYLSSQFAKRTAKVYVSGSKFFLDWMVVMRLIEPTYAEGVRIRKAVELMSRKRSDPLPHIPQKGHAEMMLDAVREINEPSPQKERDLALLLFLATSGCRNAEATRVRVGDIDMVERQVILTGKNEKQRIVFFSEDTRDAIREYWKVRGWANKDDPAFARHDKGAGKKRSPVTPATVRNVVANVVKLAGIDKGKFTPHFFRHDFAIKLLQKTHDLAVVQDALGHSTPAITRVYATIYPEDLRAAHRKTFDPGSDEAQK